jgi:two-component system, NtrC family, sensor kinase
MGEHLSKPFMNKKFSQKISFVIMLIGLTPLVIVTSVAMDQYRHAYQAKVYSHLDELVQKHGRLIDLFLEERLRDISYLAQTSNCEQLQNKAYLQNRFEILQEESNNVFTDMGVVEIDVPGRQIAYAGPFDLDNARYGAAGWFREASRRDHFISNVFLGLRDSPHFIVAVQKTCGQNHWIVRATIDFSAFSRVVENLSNGETGHAFIINRQGILQTRPRRAVDETVPGETVFENFDTLKILFHNGQKALRRHISADGKTLVVTAYIKSGDWLLVYQQENADVFSELTRTHKIAFGALFIGGVGIVVLALYLPTVILLKISQEFERKNTSLKTGKPCR